MKRKWTWYLLALTAALGCGGEPTHPGNQDPQARDTAHVEGNTVMGNVKRVYALGHFFAGEPSPDWRLYEEYTYDDAGREILYVSYFDGVGTRIETQYDAQGYEVLKVRSGSDKAGKMEFRSIWNPDHTEQKTEEFSIQESRAVSRAVRRFDQRGVLQEVQEEDLHIPEYPIHHTLKMVYDRAGRVTEERETSLGKEVVGTQYRYDAQGNPVEVLHMDSEGSPSQMDTYEYDEQGRKVAHFLQDYGAYYPSRQLEARYVYNPAGQLEREVHHKGRCDETGQRAGQCPVSETITLVYDAEGRVIRETVMRQHPTPRTLEKRFEYFGKVPVK